MNAARRLSRTAGLLFGPCVWLFALLGAGLVAFPPDPLRLEGDVVRPVRAAWPAKVDAEHGEWTLRGSGTWPPPAAAWHPRFVTVALLGGPLSDGWADVQLYFDPDVDPETADLLHGYVIGQTSWRGDPSGVWRPAAGLAAGTLAAGPAEFRGTADRLGGRLDGGNRPPRPAEVAAVVGPPHRVRGFAVSLWPLLALAGSIGAVRWAVAARRGEAADGPAERVPLLTKLARPWVWGSAAAGLACTLLIGLPVGGSLCTVDIARGPADMPHPRVLTVDRWCSPVGGGPVAAAALSAPRAGVWRTVRPDRRNGPTARNVRWCVSLWYSAAVGLAGNAATLWRTRRAVKESA